MNVRSLFSLALSGACFTLAPGCGNSTSPLPLTDRGAFVPVQSRAAEADERNANRVDERESLLADGLGDITRAGAETHATLVLGGGNAPTPGPNAQLISRFVHMADAQLTDDESPGRLTRVDGPGLTASAFRPQDAYSCHLLAAMARSVHRVDEALEGGVDFVILGGDNIDNAQGNELTWFLSVLGQPGTVECDSGADDDPVPGGSAHEDDPKDPFEVEGLRIPYYWVNGNHDVLVQGNFVPSDTDQAAVVGSNAIGFARDWSQPGGPLGRAVAPDATRAYLTRTELLTRVAGDGNGHGVSSASTGTGRANYAIDIEGTPLRFIAMDTTGPQGSASGVLKRSTFDAEIAPLIDAAATDGKWVIVASHHATSSLTDGGGLGGVAEPDAMTPAEVQAYFASQPHVIGTLVAHSHQHRVREYGDADGRYFEIMTAAILDFPHESRLVEVFDEDNGFLRIRLTGIQPDIANDNVARHAFELGVMDWVSAWADDGATPAGEGNVDLYLPRPN